jgi:hypothetical protein
MVALVLTAGCATELTPDKKRLLANVAAKQQQVAEFNRIRDFAVEVESDPPGAMIEVNADARGRAPCKILVPGRGDRTLPSMGHFVKIIAIPSEPGESEQSKLLLPGDKIPERMFFNMRLSRPPPQIDVHVDE